MTRRGTFAPKERSRKEVVVGASPRSAPESVLLVLTMREAPLLKDQQRGFFVFAVN